MSNILALPMGRADAFQQGVLGVGVNPDASD